MNADAALQPMAEAVQSATMDKIVRAVVLASSVQGGKPTRSAPKRFGTETR
jgi:hypothetical protein